MLSFDEQCHYRAYLKKCFAHCDAWLLDISSMFWIRPLHNNDDESPYFKAQHNHRAIFSTLAVKNILRKARLLTSLCSEPGVRVGLSLELSKALGCNANGNSCCRGCMSAGRPASGGSPWTNCWEFTPPRPPPLQPPQGMQEPTPILVCKAALLVSLQCFCNPH